MAIIGIDLGTTNSLVSCYIDGESRLIPNGLGEYLTPSVVSVMGKGEIVVGAAAKERLSIYPDRTAAAFKRDMGSNKKFFLGEKIFTATDLSAFVLRSLKSDAEAFLREPVTEAIISVPAYFNDHQRRATKDAGALAGMKVERLINEPTAAAIAYGLNQGGECNVLVFDLGGGTFDVSVLEIADNIMEVHAVAGDNHLGGEDFDELLVKYFLEQSGLQENQLSLRDYAHIKKLAEQCKIVLSGAQEAEISAAINGKVCKIEINHNQFEELCQPLMERLRSPLVRSIKDSGLHLSDLNQVLLVGGSTKMSLVRGFVARMFGVFPLNTIDPDQVVGVGAGVYAAMKARNEELRENVLTDVCPYTLGTEIVMQNVFGDYDAGQFLPIIERNTTIPYSKVERLCTIKDQQTRINVGIFQGENRRTSNNLKLGELEVAVPAAKAGEQSIDVRYTYDINGILEVEVTVVSTGIKRQMVIVDKGSALSEEQIARRLKELEKIKIHPREEAQNAYLLSKGERLFEETLADLRMTIGRELAQFEAILRRQNQKEIKEAAERFAAFLTKIENGELW